MEQKINEVYLLCMMFGNETEILGVFTKEKKLLEAYDILMNEDGRCREEKYIGKRHFSQKPIIYKTPLDKFLGRKEEWYLDNEYIFLDTIDEYEVDIEKLRRKIAEFYGFEVYCDFDEMTEARFSIFYHCDEELATGGTMEAACKLVKQMNPKKVYVNFIIELKELHGKDVFGDDVEVEAVLSL